MLDYVVPQVDGRHVEAGLAAPTPKSSKKKWALGITALVLGAMGGGGYGAYVAITNAKKASSQGGAAHTGIPNTTGTPNTNSSSGPSLGAASTVVGLEPWPNVGFGNTYDVNGGLTVALTFDDGPDAGSVDNNATMHVMDFLGSRNLPGTFFLCGNVWTLVNSNPAAQNTISRMVTEGYSIASHSYTHPHLELLTPAGISDQFNQNANMLSNIFGQSVLFNMVRAPFGAPFQSNDQNVSWVAPNLAPYGVHIGWGIDTDDWKCSNDNQGVSCILNNLEAQLIAGQSGPILMHAVYDLTVQALPQVVSMLETYNRTIVSVEDMILAKYNTTSTGLMTAWRSQQYSAQNIGKDAVTQNSQNAKIVPLYR